GQLALLAARELPARPWPAVARQAAGARLPRGAGRGGQVGQEGAAAAPAVPCDRRDIRAVPRAVPSADRLHARRVPHARSRRGAGAGVAMRRPRLQQGVIIIPSALTLGNLFFGVWAIVSAASGDFLRAGWLIVFAGIFDTLDGRVARATQTGSRFGEELDSLVDAISFGVAPAMIMYHLFLAQWRWLELMVGLMLVIAFLMMSHVLYPVVPKIGFRTRRHILNGLFLGTMVILAITIPRLFFFPALVGYLGYGVLKWTLLGF